MSGRNVYAILRAGRARSTESIILSSPYLSAAEGDNNVHGTAVMLALAKYFKGWFANCTVCIEIDFPFSVFLSQELLGQRFDIPGD